MQLVLCMVPAWKNLTLHSEIGAEGNFSSSDGAPPASYTASIVSGGDDQKVYKVNALSPSTPF